MIGVISVIAVIEPKKIEIAFVIAVITVIGVIESKKILRVFVPTCLGLGSRLTIGCIKSARV